MILIYILIVLLLSWLINALTIYIKKRKTVYEGLDNPPSPAVYTVSNGSTDPAYLSNLNASNVTYLKGQVDSLMALKQQVTDINTQVGTLTTTVNGLSQKLGANVSSTTNCDPSNTDSCPMHSIAANAVS
jgi:hypothetical protein